MRKVDQNHSREKEFKKINLSISEYLKIEPISGDFRVAMQPKESNLQIPELGLSFGTSLEEPDRIILANWLFELSDKKQKSLINYILTRENFRLYLSRELPADHEFSLLVDIILEYLSILYIFEKEDYNLMSAPIATIRNRVDAYKADGVFESQFWIFFLLKCHQYNLSAKQIFDKLISKTKGGRI